MPIYEYECLTCGVTFEKRQSFSDESKAKCPNGHAETRRLLATPAIVFKGSGFYINDSRASSSTGSKPAATSESAASSGESGGKSEGDSGTSDAAKPAGESATAPSASPAPAATGTTSTPNN